jgi:hypothetical protein
MEDWICEACNGPLTSLGVLGATEHARCLACGLDHNRPAQILRDEEGLSAEELADGLAQFDATFGNVILTRPGESLITTVQAARDEGSDEPDADLDWGNEHDSPSNDMKPRGRS